jgi:hypothetical protein
VVVRIRSEGTGRKARVVFARYDEPYTHAVATAPCRVDDRGRAGAFAVFGDGYEASASGLLVAASNGFKGFDLVEGRS